MSPESMDKLVDAVAQIVKVILGAVAERKAAELSDGE